MRSTAKCRTSTTGYRRSICRWLEGGSDASARAGNISQSAQSLVSQIPSLCDIERCRLDAGLLRPSTRFSPRFE